MKREMMAKKLTSPAVELKYENKNPKTKVAYGESKLSRKSHVDMMRRAHGCNDGKPC